MEKALRHNDEKSEQSFEGRTHKIPFTETVQKLKVVELKGVRLTPDTKHIARYVWNGQRDRYWYQETLAGIKKLFPDRDSAVICDLLAATSQNTSLKGNVQQFYKALHQLENNLPFTGYLKEMAANLERAKQRIPLGGRKIRNFSEAMNGNPDAVVVDIWIMRSFGFNQSRPVPTDALYTKIENYIRKEAQHMRLQPREMCAMIWSGVRSQD